MSFTPYGTAVAGSILTAAFWNQQIRDNGVELRGGGFAMAGQTANDLIFANSAVQLGRVYAAADPTAVMLGGNPPSMMKALGRQSIWIPAGAFFRDVGYPCLPLADYSNGDPWTGTWGYPYQGAAYVQASATLVAPKAWNRSNCYGRVYWMSNTPNAFVPQWYLWCCNSFDAGADLTWYAGNGGVVTDASNGQNLLNISPEITFGFNPAPNEGSLLRFVVLRANDSYATNALFLGVMLSFVMTAFVDD